MRLGVDAWSNIAGRSAGGIILQMGYGYRVKDGADPLVQLVDRALVGLTAAATPGSFLVDIVPARTRSNAGSSVGVC